MDISISNSNTIHVKTRAGQSFQIQDIGDGKLYIMLTGLGKLQVEGGGGNKMDRLPGEHYLVMLEKSNAAH